MLALSPFPPFSHKSTQINFPAFSRPKHTFFGILRRFHVNNRIRCQILLEVVPSQTFVIFPEKFWLAVLPLEMSPDSDFAFFVVFVLEAEALRRRVLALVSVSDRFALVVLVDEFWVDVLDHLVDILVAIQRLALKFLKLVKFVEFESCLILVLVLKFCS